MFDHLTVCQQKVNSYKTEFFEIEMFLHLTECKQKKTLIK